MTRPPASPRLARGLEALARRAARHTPRRAGGAKGRRASLAAARPRADLEIVLMGDRAIRALNRRFHKTDRPTDVLAFDLGDTLDVAVSVDRARVQAKALGHSLRREIGHLVVHGLLHVSGWRDDSPSKLVRMNEAAERTLKGAGWIR